ncbi:hypothetical protein [Ktedonobacter sp. SOSP1-52]|uniref:hypothetical protein n=1 Tax=Ktedonobacter sp. SOSP1-52 TaxID=2778366 RepID=UPI001914F421|nr:hypothetical protein [Ktedonobacter sp. SOSP1-52]
MVYGASIHDCRPCSLREQCQCNGSTTTKPRQMSLLLHPLPVGSAPLLWRDWSRRNLRRTCLRLHRQHLDIQMGPEGFYYDTELKMIPALKPRLAFVPNVGMLKGVFEDKETSELLVTIHWSQRNRRDSASFQQHCVTGCYFS